MNLFLPPEPCFPIPIKEILLVEGSPKEHLLAPEVYVLASQERVFGVNNKYKSYKLTKKVYEKHKKIVSGI